MPNPLSPLFATLQPLQQLAQSAQVTSLVRRANSVTPVVLDKLPPVAAQPLRVILDRVDDFLGIELDDAAQVQGDVGQRDAAHAEIPGPAELPIEGYDGLNAQSARSRIQELHDVEEVQAVIAHERQHKNRSSVLGVADQWLGELQAGTVATS